MTETSMMTHTPASPLKDMSIGDATTLVDLLRHRAAQHGDKRALTFLPDGEKVGESLTYAELDARARAIAASLQAQGMHGGRVLLIFHSGLEFACALLGCMYAGAIAVPIYPPKANRNVLRLRSVYQDATPALALTTAAIQQRTRPLLEECGLDSLRMEAVEGWWQSHADAWFRPDIDGETLAFLQYTSGSTSNPKGVMLSHANLLANHRMMQEAFGHTHECRILTWLPLFHDMGLIGNMLQSLYLGGECIIMPPEAFFMKPLRWLAAISAHRATRSGAPNFAYDLCVRKIKPEQCRALDLSCWVTADVAAEPVRHGTLERFAETFAGVGFSDTAFNPAYGLAEASVFVSARDKGRGFRGTAFKTAALACGRVEPAETGADSDARIYVGCGHTWQAQEMAIVHPQSGVRCAEGEVGEVWLSGPHVARGYWNRVEESERTFGARIAGEESSIATRYLRTGDLGFFYQGDLHLAGRIKDIIIVAGRNHDPADIELTVGGCHPAIRMGGCAAFQVETEEESRVVIAVELERTSGILGDAAPEDENSTSAVMLAIRKCVADHHDLAPHDVTLLKPAALPKTSSGKIQRHACRAAWQSGSMNAWQWTR
ncbi:fatty acyl-AMP ligase [Roseimicrobium sp. ORNL1]|uniref:fatty acyl-AMP ligase n=1 Tax=Roseimicrobium sp. ORNL1 TaxID=2711231 RepID=UPI0013E20190|nr:fatty acyl-AMP ligase [Roseimicrobium sp. ORNL1]QIF01300.1 fatty acyl-AMP ligase [Roseimicrobium sp. ORNL1]